MAIPGIRRRSTRTPSFTTSIRLQNLFFQPSSLSSGSKLSSKVTVLNEDPPIYLIEDFLSENEYHYFDQLCTQYDKSFVASFTEDELNGKVNN